MKSWISQSVEERIDELRTTAMAEIWAKRGFDGTVALLAGTDAAHVVGRYAASPSRDPNVAANTLRSCLAADMVPGEKIDAFMRGFMWSLDHSHRSELLSTVVEEEFAGH